VGAPGPLWLLGLLRLRSVWVWEAGAGLCGCGGYVRWIGPLGVLGDISVESGPGWSGVGWVKWKERESGMGGWEIGEGVGWGGWGFQVKRDGHRALRGGWPFWLEIPIYISLLPDALIDILHNSRWLLFHPRAVTPLGSSPRTRVSASVHYACSRLCTCVQGDQVHHTREASRKSVTCHLLREVNPIVVFDLIMITTAKSSHLLLHCRVQPPLRAPFGCGSVLLL
jgi:hypothetical protein